MAQQPKEERTVEIIVNGTKANASLKEMAAAAAVLSNQVAKIAADDPKRGELIAQLQTMRQRITDTRAEIGGLLTAEQQLAAANQQLAESQAAAVAEQARAIEVGKAGAASYNQMRTAAGLLEKQLHELGANDPGRAALLTDLQTLRGRLEQAREAMGGVIKTEAQQRAEAEALRQKEQALAEAEASRAQAQVQLVVNGQRVTASMREMREGAAELERQLNDLAQDDPARGPLIKALQELKSRIHDVQQEVAGVSRTTSTMKQVMTNAFAFAVGGGIEQGIEKIVETGKSVFDTTAKFETYGIVLEKALGSKSLAQQAMADIQQMAAQTPFSVQELTESFVKFVNRGLTPSMAEMTKLGDLAASQGKSFDQLTEAVLDAGTGEFERLKEFGISASKSGDQVSLSFKGVQQTVANTPEAINAAILAFGDMQSVAGGMAAIAGTLEGSLSNVGDTADQVAVQWGQTLRPAFVAVLNTVGFVLNVFKVLPGFLRENKEAVGLLALAVLAFNMEQLKAQVATLRTLVLDKLVTVGLLTRTAATTEGAAATYALTASQWSLNAALNANPIGAIILLVSLLVLGLKQLYDRSEAFRGAVNSLFRMLGPLGDQFRSLLAQLAPVVRKLEEVFDSIGGGHEVLEVFGKLMGVSVVLPLKLMVTQIQTTIDVLAAFWDMGKRVANWFGADFQVDPNGSFDTFTKHLVENGKSIGRTLIGVDAAAEEANFSMIAVYQGVLNLQADFLAKAQGQQKKASAGARLEALKNEEADLKERLAKAKEGSEAEMRLKQKLVTNAAAQELLDEKKTAADRRIILAEAEGKRVQLAQEFYEKQAKERETAAKKAAEEELKRRLADIEAEQHHQEAKLKLGQAAMVARGDERVSELSAIYTDGQLRIAALEAASKKEILKITGTAAEKKARTLDLEKELAAEKALLADKVRRDQQDKLDKWAKEDAAAQEKFIDGQIEDIEEQATRQQAAFDVLLSAGLESQQSADAAKYEARQAAFRQELILIEASLGKESAAYKRVNDKMVKDQTDTTKREVALREKATKEKIALQKMEMSVAGDVLSFGLELLGQDAEARKKHHSLYTALAAAKIIIDGTKEVQQIWEYSAQNPANPGTMGTAGIIMGTIQTGVAIARTAVALSKLGGGGGDSGDNTSYAKGGATGTGAGLAVSPIGQLMQMSGMSVGTNGRLTDGSGFAVAGVVHEDEYVIPKWQLQDPQVAAVAQWLEARRLRGFADGGHTSASSGAALPVAAASPSTDGERTYAVQTQMLDALLTMGQQLADVKQWQRDLQVRLDLRATQAGMDEYKQVQHRSAIRSKSGPSK